MEQEFIFEEKEINLKKTLENSLKKLKIESIEKLKGVKGLISEKKIFEPMEKGILRAMNDLHVFKDGTIRYEAIDVPLTQFKIKEIQTSIKKIKELGYEFYINGNPIEKEEQLIELMPQDIIINEESVDFF